MIKLEKVIIHKYKSIEAQQNLEIEENVTILVGMNESGKTSVLEALAKSNYFENDAKFKFNTTHDYPRKEKKKIDKSGEVPDAISCTYKIAGELHDEIAADLGEGVFSQETFTVTRNYENTQSWKNVEVSHENFFKNKIKVLGVTDKTLKEKLAKLKSKESYDIILAEYAESEHKNSIENLSKYFENSWKWKHDFLGEYVARKWLRPNLPKFLYYDEFYMLPSRISIESLNSQSLQLEEQKTAKALFELADINIEELISAEDFEDYKAELEATEATISEELFQFWSTNKNLEIQFDIDKIEKTDSNGNTRIVEHVLDIRVRNTRSKVSLPLKNRSKGFNWFFSFLVWFKKIQEDKKSSYILLLDEPGLNLHASAQADLLEFIETLASEYQIIYTTHSPFMVDPKSLTRVRTVVETNNGTIISDSLQEKDPQTLFPLQAALGYDIAQNLFISQNNLLVEGVSDLIYLQLFSGLLQQAGKTCLREDITIVPVGGMEKVSTFVSLLRGSKLNIVCLLDSSIDLSSKSKLDKLIAEKIIQKRNVLFYDEFIAAMSEADVEDLFEKSEYLKYFNQAFQEHRDLSLSDVAESSKRIILQINLALSISRFNHYRPANQLVRSSVTVADFSEETIKHFESVFAKINSLM